MAQSSLDLPYSPEERLSPDQPGDDDAPDLERHGLRTDVSGMPIGWIGYRDAVRLYHANLVVYSLGTVLYRIHGGVNAITGQRSVIEVSSIIATRSDQHARMKSHHAYVPPLSNDALFARDGLMCMYCGESPSPRWLSRDHVTPLSSGGADDWTNVVSACKRCNNHKAGRTPEQADMKLLAVPFAPNHAEYVYLRGRRVHADQMEFLAAHFPRRSPLRARLLQGTHQNPD